jgi:hypothetical protein
MFDFLNDDLGLSAPAFNKQLARLVVPSEKRIAATSGILHRYDPTISGIRGIDLEKSEVMDEPFCPSPSMGLSSSLSIGSSTSFVP